MRHFLWLPHSLSLSLSHIYIYIYIFFFFIKKKQRQKKAKQNMWDEIWHLWETGDFTPHTNEGGNWTHGCPMHLSTASILPPSHYPVYSLNTSTNRLSIAVHDRASMGVFATIARVLISIIGSSPIVALSSVQRRSLQICCRFMYL